MNEFDRALAANPGGFDEGILPWLRQINMIPGVETLQSCTGHIRENEERGSDDGTLWIRLDDYRGEPWIAMQLNLHPGWITSVCHEYRREDCLIVTFQPAVFPAVMPLIVDVLRRWQQVFHGGNKASFVQRIVTREEAPTC